MNTSLDDKLTPEILAQLFQNEERCLEFIAQIKWENGFICRKCGGTNYCSGKSTYSRRCTKCKAEESAITGTIFQNTRFSICKAFYIAFNVCKGNEELSSYEFALRLSLRQMTCWKFKNKIQKTLNSMDSLLENEKRSILRILKKSDY